MAKITHFIVLFIENAVRIAPSHSAVPCWSAAASERQVKGINISPKWIEWNGNSE